MNFRIFTFEDDINKLDVIVHIKPSYEIEIVAERYRKKSPTKDESYDSELCVTVADSGRECDKLLVVRESHSLFSERFSFGVVGHHVFASLNESEDVRYNIGCVYGDHDDLVEKFNVLVDYLISIGFPIIRAREADAYDGGNI